MWWRVVSSAQVNCTSHHSQSTNMDKSDPPLSSTSLDSAKADSTSKFHYARISPRVSVLTNFASRVNCDWVGWDSAWMHLCNHSPSKKSSKPTCNIVQQRCRGSMFAGFAAARAHPRILQSRAESRTRQVPHRTMARAGYGSTPNQQHPSIRSSSTPTGEGCNLHWV